MSKRFNLAGQMPLISLIVLCAVTALLTNRFLSPLNLTNILVQSSIMAVIAMGMTADDNLNVAEFQAEFGHGVLNDRDIHLVSGIDQDVAFRCIDDK